MFLFIEREGEIVRFEVIVRRFINLICFVLGIFRLEIFWFRVNKVIKEDFVNYMLFNDGWILFIFNVFSEDLSRFICCVKNVVGNNEKVFDF